MASYQQGTAQIFGTSATSGVPPTYTVYDATGTTLGSGWVNPITASVSVSHQASVETVTNESGDVVAVIGHGEYLEATFELIPSGSSVANARKAATLFPLGSTVVTAGFDVIRMGPFADGLNVAGGSAPETSRWLYNGGATDKITSDGKAGLSVPLKRYPYIVGGAAIVD